MKKLLALALTAALAGCSTDLVTLANAKQALPNHIYTPEIVGQPKDPEQGTITILRDKGFTGSACTFDVALNGKKSFSLGQGEYLTVQLPPKDYILAAAIGGGLCPNLMLTQTANLKAGDEQEYRIGWASSGQWMFARLK